MHEHKCMHAHTYMGNNASVLLYSIFEWLCYHGYYRKFTLLLLLCRWFVLEIHICKSWSIHCITFIWHHYHDYYHYVAACYCFRKKNRQRSNETKQLRRNTSTSCYGSSENAERNESRVLAKHHTMTPQILLLTSYKTNGQRELNDAAICAINKACKFTLKTLQHSSLSAVMCSSQVLDRNDLAVNSLWLELVGKCLALYYCSAGDKLILWRHTFCQTFEWQVIHSSLTSFQITEWS